MVFEGVASKIRLGWSFCQGSLTVPTKRNSRVRVYKKRSNGKWQHIKEATRQSNWHFTGTLRGLSCDGLKVTGSNTEHRKRLGWLQLSGSVFAWLWNMQYKSRQRVSSGHLYCRPKVATPFNLALLPEQPYASASVRVPVSECQCPNAAVWYCGSTQGQELPKGLVADLSTTFKWASPKPRNRQVCFVSSSCIIHVIRFIQKKHARFEKHVDIYLFFIIDFTHAMHLLITNMLFVYMCICRAYNSSEEKKSLHKQCF